MPRISLPNKAIAKELATAVVKLPRAAKIVERDPSIRRLYLLTAIPTGIERKMPGTITIDVKNPNSASLAPNSIRTLERSGGIA